MIVSFGAIQPLAHAPITLSSPNAQINGFFGETVVSGIDGTTNYVVVAAAYETVGGLPVAGHAYVFNEKTGILLHTLTSPSPQAYTQFGAVLGAGNNLIVAGSPEETANGLSVAGHVYTFNPLTGSLIATYSSPNAQTNGRFGFAVAVGSGVIVVGAPNETANGFGNAGHVYIINVNTGTIFTLTSPNAQTGGDFGNSVAVSGLYVVVGARYETSGGQLEAGNAYIFSTKTGNLIHGLNNPSPQSAFYVGNFGNLVAISGTTAAIAAPNNQVAGQTRAGNVYLFNAKTGSLLRTLASPNPQYYGHFGYGLAISSTLVFVGASYETSHGLTRAGNVYSFNPKTGLLLNTYTSPNAQLEGDFGENVSVTGSLFAIGATNETASGLTGAGHAYIY